MSDYTQLIHRISLGQKPEDFYFIGGVWSENNPEWNVVNWDESCLEDFTDLRAVFDLYKGQHSLLETVIGIALVEKWGGVFIHHEVMPPFPLAKDLPQTAWMNFERTMFGSQEPGDPFWHDFLGKLPTTYLRDLNGPVLDNYIDSSAIDLLVVA